MVATTLSVTSAGIRERAFNEARIQSQSFSHLVQGELDRRMEIARSTARAFESLHTAGIEDRASYDNLLKTQLTAHPELLCAWSVWEPNALDGNDRAHINKAGSDATARYIPAWTRTKDGSLKVDPNIDYEKPGPGDYYQVPKKTDRESLVEPYFYSYTGVKGEEQFIASFVVPIHLGGKFVGVVGSDIDLGAIDKIMADHKVFQSGYLILASNQGMRLSHPKKELIGKVLGDEVPDQKDALLKAIAAGQNYELIKKNLATGQQSLLVFSPVGVGDWSSPWSVWSSFSPSSG